MFGLSWWTLAKYGIPLLVVGLSAFFVWHFSSTWIAEYNKSFAEVAKLRATVEKYQRREASYIRQLERYKAAVKKSSCASQIGRWVKNPDEIPKDFNPHEQFTAPNLRSAPHDNVDTAQPYDEFEWKWEWPWPFNKVF